MSQTPTLAGTISAKIAAVLAGVHTSVPGRVESYSEATGLANVQPTVKDPATGEDYPVVPNVPVALPGTAGGRIKFLVLPGDTVLLLSASCSLDRWKATGGAGVGGRAVDPADPRKHDLTDSIAIPFSYTGSAFPEIEFTLTGEIHAGGSSALATRAELAQLVDWILGATDGAGFGSALKTSISGDPTFPVGTSILKGA